MRYSVQTMTDFKGRTANILLAIPLVDKRRPQGTRVAGSIAMAMHGGESLALPSSRRGGKNFI